MRIAVAGMIVLVTLLLGALAASNSCAGEPKNISSTQAKALLAKDSKILLLDVRTPEEYGQAHLRGALLIPLSDLGKRVQEIPHNRPLLVYCSVGARSASAAGFLAAHGYGEIYQISDGLVGWYKNGFPIEK
jgi:phage shock protein E